MLPLLMSVLGCPASPPPATALGPIFQVTSPSPGARLRVPWVPIVVRLTEPFLEGSAEIWVDDQALDPSHQVIRERNAGLGGGVDLIGLLDLNALEPGTHTLSFRLTTAEGRAIAQAQEFHWDRPPHAVDLEVWDAEGAPAAARVAIWRDGEPLELYGPAGVEADPRRRDTELHSVFVVGQSRIWLDEGDYTFLASSGIREGIDEQALVVDGPAVVRFDSQLLVPTPGWLSADFHVHSARSPDSFVPDALRFDSLLASGLDLYVLSDHDRLPEPGLELDRLLAGRALVGMAGVEASVSVPWVQDKSGTRSIAHVNAFPLDEGPLPPGDMGLAATLDAFRDPGHPVVLQLNHPRGIHFRKEQAPIPLAYGVFYHYPLDPALPLHGPENAWWTTPDPTSGVRPLDVDAVELVNRFSWPLWLLVRSDWFALLTAGERITATGNSDSHALEVERAGIPVNLLPCAPDDPGVEACVVEALHDGKVTVSTGPVVEIELSSEGRTAGPGEVLQAGERIEVRIRVRAAPWVPVEVVRLVIGGQVLWHASVAGVERDARGVLDQQFVLPPLELDRDTWVLAEAGWPLDQEPPADFGNYSLIAPGAVPLGFTNPVFLDTGGGLRHLDPYAPRRGISRW